MKTVIPTQHSDTPVGPANSDEQLALVTEGRQEEAVYKDTGIPGYAGNPLIEALPSILSESAIAQALTVYPPYNEKERSLPNEVRLHLIETVLRLRQPLPVHVDLEQRF